ncbi:type VI secretion system-associated FHA domain protein TagH [Marinomonas sp. THO17]|uniref:type VI secretion system-associated FHA domain protein TagH n=1 Tax=Marinomonas sp. THO17 TaxID=3149048 RepID=UPI00336BC8F2
MNRQKELNLIVVNVASLEVGLSAKSSFNVKGGMIGSNSNLDWHLIDKDKTISPVHAEILYKDGAFCIKDISGKTYVNYSEMPLGYDKLARLSDGDMIQIGDYEIRVFVDRDADLKETDHSLDKLFPSIDSVLLEGMDDDDDFDMSELDLPKEDKQEDISLDPLFALDQEVIDVQQEDSLLEDEEEEPELEENEVLELIHQSQGMTKLEFTMQADSEDDISSAIRFSKPNPGQALSVLEKTTKSLINKDVEKMGDSNILDYLDNEIIMNSDEESSADNDYLNDDELLAQEIQDVSVETNNHVLSGPIADGLGVDVGKHLKIAEMQELSAEVAMTLRSCIKGLLALHSQVKDTRYGVIHRSLQPIEDNPLNLGLSYEETVKVMFDDKGNHIHLSPASSVEESMNMIQIHNVAVQHAINSALNQILQSLSPEVMIKRFKRYARMNTPANEGNGAWAWQMYERYYKELTSNRQQGFEKLFWEIFEQSYDRKVREKHAEH